MLAGQRKSTAPATRSVSGLIAPVDSRAETRIREKHDSDLMMSFMSERCQSSDSVPAEKITYYRVGGRLKMQAAQLS